MSQGVEASERLNSAASPENSPARVSGSPSLAPAARISLTAWLSETPGARSKPMVTAGNWSCRVIVSGPARWLMVAMAASGTW